MLPKMALSALLPRARQLSAGQQFTAAAQSFQQKQPFSSTPSSQEPGQQQGQQQAGSQQQQQQQQQQWQEQIDFGFKQVPREEKVGLVAQVFSSVASSYDVMNDLMSAGMHRLWKDQFVETLRPFPGMVHLDVAGGTGDIAFRVLRALRASELQARSRGGPPGSLPPPGSVTVFDINPQMLAEGHKKAQAAPDLQGDTGLQFVEGNAERLPFPDNHFDSYTIAFGIRNVTDRPAALREAFRVLKPGGRFLCLEFSRVETSGLREFYDAYSFHVIPQIGALVANDRGSYQYLVESIRQFPDQSAFAGLIEDAGFKSVGYENILNGVVAIHSGFKY